MNKKKKKKKRIIYKNHEEKRKGERKFKSIKARPTGIAGKYSGR